MAYIQTSDRFQLQMSCLEERIERDNPVRFIDAFVDHLDLCSLGFQILEQKNEGRPSFDPKVFLKLYLYGYLNSQDIV